MRASNIQSFVSIHKNKIYLAIVLVLILTFVALKLCNDIIVSETNGMLYDNADSIPKNRVGLLLGTNKILPNGYENPYFKYRIEATARLYHAGKIDRIIVSGDNSRKEYNEAEYMRTGLVALGVPDSCIYLDYAGFRTFDSVLRCREIFGQTKYTVISQRFHNERAIFIAKREGMDVVGFNARDVGKAFGFNVMMRERFARVKVFLDLYVLNTKPKFLGAKIEVK
jgi:SanA protein